MKAELLINARSRSSAKSLPAIQAACVRHGIELTRTHTLRDLRQIKRVLNGVVKRPGSLLIVGGGDGTISAVVNAAAYMKLELGLIPLGTTNNFARSLNLPLEIDEAVERIATKKARSVDLGRVGNDYFSSVASIGISAEIAQRVTNTDKRRFGRFAYALVGLRTLLSHRAFAVTVSDKDDEMSLHFETHQLIIANGRYHAGKEIVEDAAVDNHELIIFALGGRRKLSFVRHMVDFYLGRRKSIKHSSYFIGRDVKVRTSRRQPVELDGEVKRHTPLNATVEGGAIKIRH